MIGAKPKPTCSQRIGQALADAILFVPRIAYYAIRAAKQNQQEQDAESARLRTIIRDQASDIKMLRDELDEARERATKVATERSSEVTNVVSWIAEFEARHGRKPRLPELREEFPDVPKTTAWRRIRGM